MSKLNVGVGEEFPLDEAQGPDRHNHRHCGHGRWRHHHMHHHGHHHHGHRRFWRLPFLLLAIGLIALIVQHKLPVQAAYGLIALGATLMAIKLVWHLIGHWREHRRMVSE
jgi:hypothetical protein